MKNMSSREKYKFIAKFVMKFGLKHTSGQNSYWSYDDGNLKLFYREFMRKSSFIFITVKERESYFIDYAIKEDLTVQNGEISDLEEIYDKLIYEAQIKEYLLINSNKIKKSLI
jgi:hypothetical protein